MNVGKVQILARGIEKPQEGEKFERNARRSSRLSADSHIQI